MYAERHGDVDFTFAGQGEMEGTIRQFAAAHGLENVRVRDVPSPVDVLKDIDVFVHPGIDDAMPVSIVEALMCGCPCVATRVGGIPDLIRDGVEGFLIQPGSAVEILRGMECFARMSAAELSEFNKRGRKRYEEACRPEKVGAVVAEHYREILAANSNEHARE